MAVALQLPGSNQVVSQFAPLVLIPDGAGELTCKEILELSHQQAPFLTGFVVVESKTQLDVVPVYTATDPSGKSISIEVKPTAARIIPPPKLPDLAISGNCYYLQQSAGGGFIAAATIQNIGAAPAGASVTRFILTPSDGSPGASVDVPTPPLAVGGSVTLTVPVPGAFFRPNVDIEVQADATNQVIESNETNNSTTALCPG